MWHLVCGDAAVPGVTLVLGQARADDALRVLRDDLAVGPLADIEQPPCAARVAYWQALWPQAMLVPDFHGGLNDDARWLAALAQQERPVTVWHGDSACEQLLLARVAAALEGTGLGLWEVSCGTGDSGVASRRSVTMVEPADLPALYRPQPIEPQRRRQLAAQWRATLAESAPIRRWRDGAFQGEDHDAIDASLVQWCSVQWQPLLRVLAEVMARCDGFFPTDMFLFWRVRELAASGLLELAGGTHVSDTGELRVRRRHGA
ncbi:DUF3658 domain-containing protein [Pseudomonas benzenivorans]|uniref:DUF3658 domain-containing protein n=1 Tax=Pseudomonas benzenivorans TaxID=556533 RepID=A0ABZ0PW10_9PSED|nr:DUF3658 domain-containing protein [Pseudomonas benzenivorans]WPC05095.1 DUF3658 domain-containing protein [Pseudomonas benzenivorans]